MIIDAPLPEPTEIVLDALPLAVLSHQTVGLDDLGTIFDEGFATLASSGLPLAGPAVAIYRGDPATSFDLELGFPVAEELTEVTQTGVRPSALPSGTALALSHIGPYDDLGAAWERLVTAALQRGAVPAAMIEIYVTEPGPQSDPATLRTDLVIPLS